MRLTKSRDDVIVSGVLAGIGEYFNIDPTLIRIGFVILAFIGVGAVIPLYIVGALIIPTAPKEEKRERGPFERRERRQPRDRRRRRAPRNFDRPRRPDVKYAKKEEFVKPTRDIEEDDWSDF